MKKVAILTFSQAINHGAVLQMYGLQQFIVSNFEVKCDVIDYISPYLAEVYQEIPKYKFVNPRVLYHLLVRNDYIKFNKDGFEHFKNTYINTSERIYYSREELLQCNDEYDYFIVGSDQVFNPYCNRFDCAYYLDFVSDEKKKNSYAASLGFSEIPAEICNMLAEKLSGFNKISLREQSCIVSLENVLNRECVRNIDPSFLLPKEKWEALADKNVNSKGEYIFVYVLSQDSKLIKYARNLGKEYNCKVIYINDRYINPHGMISLKNVGPNTWLSLLKNARAVVTNSFHGIAFSIIFDKEVHPFLLDKNTSANARILDLLDLFELRICNNKIITIEKETQVFPIIERERRKAYNYLKSILI